MFVKCDVQSERTCRSCYGPYRAIFTVAGMNHGKPGNCGKQDETMGAGYGDPKFLCASN
jgi:hypothetical protein